jgi:hypothetical protein
MFSITTKVPTRRLVASSGVGQRGWTIFSRFLTTDTGKTGAGRPSIIWNAGIMGSRLATIEIPGASATTASRKHG